MAAFDQAFELLIGHEGGYVNDPRDPGGETRYGISRRAYPGEDIRGLTLDRAKAIYERDYWRAARCDALPPPLALLVFDAAVNNGVGAAARWLQQAAGVAADGRIGPATLAAAQAPGVDRRFHAARAAMMTGLPTWGAFGKGWAKRLADLPFQAAAMRP